jgi:signal transduction histidine kinase
MSDMGGPRVGYLGPAVTPVAAEAAFGNEPATRAGEVQEEKVAGLFATAAEARNSAIIKALPDLMFVLRRDGTFVDYHTRDPKLLFVPPSAFIGRQIRDVLPPPLGELMMNALEQAYQSDEPVVVEYELPMGERQCFEARIVRVDRDRLLSIVGDVTELKRTAELNRHLARRLISSQEVERQRIARELHDDIGQRIAALNIQIEQITRQVRSEKARAQLRLLSRQANEIASDVQRISYNLHPSKLQIIGLPAALRSLCREVSKQRQLEVAFSHGTLPPSVEANVSLCLYRIVQEALHNAARHSHATSAQVSLTYENGQITMQVADSGVGFDPGNIANAGLGLVSMRERVAALDGEVTIDAVPGGGTRITARIPVAS